MEAKHCFLPPGRTPALATSSTSVVETVVGRHVFHISGYSLLCGHVQSGTFTIGGYPWCIRFSPEAPDSDKGCAIIIVLLTKGAEVTAHFNIGFMSQIDGSIHIKKTTRLIAFNTTGGHLQSAGFHARWSKEEDFSILRDDRLTIVCDVSVLVNPQTSSLEPSSGAHVPQPDLQHCMLTLLEEREGADVTFGVGDETFVAHRVVLAMRSPVLKAELYGPMRVRGDSCIIVEDMQPAVFNAFLHFIYTDSLPAIDALHVVDKKEMVRHLLVAADRYAVERLKTICQGILCNNLTVDTVADTLALADQHHCNWETLQPAKGLPALKEHVHQF
ncbi:hypothetical protein EJB05_08902, partial [Eragrostis curvula]